MMGDYSSRPAPLPPQQQVGLVVGTPLSRGIAILGIIVGFLGGLILGLIAYLGFRGWKRGTTRYPWFAWFVGSTAIGLVVGAIVASLVLGSNANQDTINSFVGIAALVLGVLGAYLLYLYDRKRAAYPTFKPKTMDLPPTASPVPRRPDGPSRFTR